ncbi:SIP domain-containing protein [Microbacterium rhizomatis]|uniref:Siderophore-interacting protein n=1 Tax=Microbacterium rhizomatis TaxID=1631477 RepID=A0A5J5J6U4_9MICO|nr:SIP domain-containing protein [Microbacterium rhizomatis]KAA9111159.1 siderophore-interacting protein [Microbacterium rhizomatis]
MTTSSPLASTEHNASVCRASRHTRVQHLITADETSLADLEVLLATLPMCSTGRVFIEIPDASWQAELDIPARMTVTWLDRSTRSGAPGTGRGCMPGEALARAVTAWSDEMLCGDASHTPGAAPGAATRIFLLGGYLGTADIVDHLTDSLGIAAEGIHTPERFGLSTAR